MVRLTKRAGERLDGGSREGRLVVVDDDIAALLIERGLAEQYDEMDPQSGARDGLGSRMDY